MTSAPRRTNDLLQPPSASRPKTRTRADVEAGGYRDGVGYNPYRKRVRRRSDVVFVGAALVVALALVLWAMLPR
jgi:hypothetical protein